MTRIIRPMATAGKAMGKLYQLEKQMKNGGLIIGDIKN